MLLFGQSILVFVQIWVVGFMLKQKNSSVSRWMLITALLGAVYNIGYFLELQAQSLHEAMTAVQIRHFGSVYMGTFCLIFVTKYCNKNLPKALETALLVFDSFIFFCVCTWEWNPMYVRRIEFVEEGLYPHLTYGKGFVYIIDAIVVLGEMLACVKIVWDAISRAKDRQKRDRYQLLLFSAVIPLIGSLLRYSGLIGEINPVPFCITLSVVAVSMAIKFQHAFDIAATAHEDILKNLNVGIIVVDHLLGFVEANPYAMENFQGLSRIKPEERLPYEELCRQFTEDAANEIVRNGKIYATQVNEMRKADRVIGYVMQLVDVTDSRRQLDHMQLLKDNADKASEAKSDFLARMSHEIRTPINAVLGMNEMILRESSESSIKKYAMDIRSAAQALLGIINDILDFSKIESGKMVLAPAKYNLSSLLNDLLNMVMVRANKKGLKVEVEVSPKLPAELYGDDVRLRQILLNILNNAVKYTEKGKVILRVSGEPCRDRVTMHFEVEDTGIGIKEEDMPNLFKAFERIDMGHNRSIEGTGLGMSITTRMLKLMDSELQVHSVYGEGSIFSFDVSQKIMSKELLGDFEERVRSTSKEYSYNVAFTAPDAKVLVVDDNDMNRNVFRNLVKKTHMQVTDVSSGMECLARVEKEHYDLIFLDFMMPTMDGIETFSRMKKLPVNMCADTPVIMLTADAVSGARERYLRQGFRDFLSKPIMPDKLEQMMKKYLPQELMSFNAAPIEEELQDNSTADAREMPEIEGMDWQYASLHFSDTALMRQTALDFYRSLKEECSKLQESADTIEHEDSLNHYRIRVHALKSTAAIIGAVSLSGLAKILEMAARGEDRERIRALHPILMEEAEACRQRLSVLEEKKEKPKRKAGNAQLTALLIMLGDALKERNYDGADMLMEQLGGFAYEEDFGEAMERLAGQVRNLEADAAVQSVDEIITQLKGGGRQ